ncbi:MAG TPA: right-handed parallel beta-helix repeat-containing protein [Candidatus Binataceae bacterium]|nr:right-handed parallel beta-helix repeat-containing protein [Candidatus Binataceae bacterium]
MINYPKSTKRVRLMLAIGALAGLFSAGTARATDITACGTTIKKPGFYAVTQDLTASQGDCIDVSAGHTIVFLGGHQITGSGSGVGIRLLTPAKFSFIEGGNSTISGFAIGIEDDASNARGDNFNANSNATGGVLVNGAQSSTFSNFQASSNGSFGVHFVLGTGSVAESAQASANGGYGIWLDGAKGVRIDNFDTEKNALAGVYIGCASNGPGGSCSARNHIGSANQVYDGFADGNGPYGIAIDATASANIVTSVESMNNKTADMIDLSKCGSDSWFGNAFASATPSNCIN